MPFTSMKPFDKIQNGKKLKYTIKTPSRLHWGQEDEAEMDAINMLACFHGLQEWKSSKKKLFDNVESDRTYYFWIGIDWSYLEVYFVVENILVKLSYHPQTWAAQSVAFTMYSQIWIFLKWWISSKNMFQWTFIRSPCDKHGLFPRDHSVSSLYPEWCGTLACDHICIATVIKSLSSYCLKHSEKKVKKPPQGFQVNCPEI